MRSISSTERGPLWPGVIYVAGDGKFGVIYRSEVKKGFETYVEAEAFIIEKQKADTVLQGEKQRAAKALAHLGLKPAEAPGV